MKFLHRLIISVLFFVSFLSGMAQDIELRTFKKEYFAPDCSIYRDLAEGCAVVFLYSNKAVQVEADLGVVYKDNDNVGFVILYLPAGTASIKISYKDYPVLFYEFPKALEANVMYSLSLFVPNKRKEDGYPYDSMNNNGDASTSPFIVASQDIRIAGFRRNPQSLLASMSPEYDNVGQACAVIRYSVDNDNYIIEPNLGVVKTKRDKPGEIIQYVPRGTKRLTVRNGTFMPVRGYEIPVEIESKATYDVSLSLSEYAVKRQKASPDHDNYLGIGYDNPELSFSPKGGTRIFTIHCNSSWDISAPSWCKLSRTVGVGTMEIEVLAKHNTTGKMRRGVIGIQSQDITVTINVEQEE